MSSDFQEKVIKDLQGVIQTCIRYFTFKEVELKIAEVNLNFIDCVNIFI